MNYNHGNPPPMIPNPSFTLPVPPPMYAAPPSFGMHGNAKQRPNRKRRIDKNPQNDRMASLEMQVKSLIQEKEDAAKAAKEEAIAAEFEKIKFAKADIDKRNAAVATELEAIKLAKADISKRDEELAKAEGKLRLAELEFGEKRAKFEAERDAFVQQRASFEQEKKDFAQQQLKLQKDDGKPWYRRSIF